MEIHESAENYLEMILMLEQKNGSVRSIDIANEMEYTKPSISRAMSLLRKNGYINMEDRGQIFLTAAGRKIAERVYERHCLLTEYLVALGVDRATAIDDACRIEHVISQESFDKIKEHVEKHI